MTMDAESVTHNALSRRATVYVCDTCGTEEALEDMLDERMPADCMGHHHRAGELAHGRRRRKA